MSSHDKWFILLCMSSTIAALSPNPIPAIVAMLVAGFAYWITGD